MAALIVTTTKFVESATLLNKIPIPKFSLVLKRVLLNLHQRNASFFNETEAAQLQKLFSLTPSELKSVLGLVAYVYENAAYATTKPPALKAKIITGGVDEKHGEAFMTAWAEEAGGVVNRLKEHAMGGPTVLNGTEWGLSVNVAQSNLARTQDAVARFELTLDKPNADNNNSNNEETLGLEFSHSELYDFFCKLETIQSQLDSVS
ncbi:hypothetical protein ScalyP_jg3143 [Parmales sp. scaly parma]|nr:hypothetical protein ScalyP_jg3143 [Parmales sp. scaly parma]